MYVVPSYITAAANGYNIICGEYVGLLSLPLPLPLCVCVMDDVHTHHPFREDAPRFSGRII